MNLNKEERTKNNRVAFKDRGEAKGIQCNRKIEEDADYGEKEIWSREVRYCSA